MDNINNFVGILELDWKNGLIFIAALIIVAVWVIAKFDFLCSRFGIKTKRMLRTEKHEEDIKELKEHADRTDDKIDKLFERMDEMRDDIKELSGEVKSMQKKQD